MTAMIGFARRFMPALTDAVEACGGALAGRRVGVALTLEPKTACLVEALVSIGAEVAVLGSGNSTQPDVAAALSERGVPVFAEPGASPGRMIELRDRFIDWGIEYLADDGAVVTRRIHVEKRPALERLAGVAEETTSGVRPLRLMEAEGSLAVACIAVNDARSKLLFDNVYGTGQSVVMAVLDATGLQMSGASVVVVGYGKVGRGIALIAEALGGRVTVTEIDPVQALVAHHDGLEVAPLMEALRTADLVLTATGLGASLGSEHLAVMRDGAIVAVGGMGRPEIDPGPATSSPTEIGPHVSSLRTDSGATVFLVADGYCVNTTAGEGNPIEVMDLSLALQLRALDYLASNELGPGVHLLPDHIDREVAASQLAAAGIRIDVPTPDQVRAATTW